MFDTRDLDRILNKLESLEDELLAVELLKEFNDKRKILGELILNKDVGLDHEAWKAKCDSAKMEVDEVLKRIEDL